MDDYVGQPPLWTHVQPLTVPICPHFHRGDSIETGQRQYEGFLGLVTCFYTCTRCNTQYSQWYKLSIGSPGSGVVYLSQIRD